MRTLRQCGMCSKGARQFFQRHNLDWSDFLKHGVDCATIERIGDAMGLQAVRMAREQEG